MDMTPLALACHAAIETDFLGELRADMDARRMIELARRHIELAADGLEMEAGLELNMLILQATPILRDLGLKHLDSQASEEPVKAGAYDEYFGGAGYWLRGR